MDLVDLLDIEPTRVTIDGRSHWRWPDGTTRPVVSGGDGPDDPPAGGGGGQGGDGDGGQGGNQFRPINSQEEFDRIVLDRVNRAKREALRDMPTTDELTQLREKAGQYDELQQQNQSELDRERSGRETAEQERDRLRDENRRIKIEAAIVAAASGKAQDPSVAATLILADPAMADAVTIDDAGQVTGADTAVSTLLEQKKFLAANGAPGSVDQGQGRGRGAPGGKPSGLEAGRELYEQRHGSRTRRKD